MISSVRAFSTIFALSLSVVGICGFKNTADSSVLLAQASVQGKKYTMSSGSTDSSVQVQGHWRITLIGSDDVSPDAGLTLTFEGGNAQFFGGCNTINTRPHFGSNTFYFSVQGMTKKACDPEIMRREAALVDCLSEVDLLSVESENVIAFYDKKNALVLAAVRDTP